MDNFNSKKTLNKMEEILETLDKTEQCLVDVYGIEIIEAAKALNNINDMRNNIKKMRGEVMEFVV